MTSLMDIARAERGRVPDPTRPVLMGQAGARQGDKHPLLPYPRNCAGERLFRLSGLSIEDYMQRFDRHNTLPFFPGREGKGDRFPLPLAREAAAAHLLRLGLDERPCIFVGKANALIYFRLVDVEMPNPLQVSPRVPWAWMPHTSGIVQVWNSPEMRDRVPPLFEKILGIGQKIS